MANNEWNEDEELHRNQNNPKTGREIAGDEDAPDIVGRTGEEMPEVAHDDSEEMAPDEMVEFEEDVVQGE